MKCKKVHEMEHNWIKNLDLSCFTKFEEVLNFAGDTTFYV